MEKDMRRVGFWPRLLAFALDAVVLVLIGIALVVGLNVLYASGVLAGSSDAERLLNALFWAIVLLYYLTEMVGAASPGKWVIGLCIAAPDGTPAEFAARALRWLARHFPGVMMLLFWITGNGLVLAIQSISATVILIGFFYTFQRDRRAWHDWWSSTAVYRRRDLAKVAPV